MSNLTQLNCTAVGAYQSQYGTPPGTQDPKSECKRWERLCDDLLAEREKLRAELGKARLEMIFAEWDQEPVPSREEVFANIDRETSFDDLIQLLKAELEAEK